MTRVKKLLNFTFPLFIVPSQLNILCLRKFRSEVPKFFLRTFLPTPCREKIMTYAQRHKHIATRYPLQIFDDRGFSISENRVLTRKVDRDVSSRQILGDLNNSKNRALYRNNGFSTKNRKMLRRMEVPSSAVTCPNLNHRLRMAKAGTFLIRAISS